MRCFPSFAAATLIALLLPAPGVAVGQTIEPGLHVGVTATTFSGDSNTDFGYRASFGAGVSFGIPVTTNLLLQPEIRYAAKGGRSDSGTIEGYDGELRIKSTVAYLEIPVLLVYRFDRGRTMQPRIFAGPYVGRRLDATIEWEPVSGGPRQSDSDDSVVEYDYGVVGGAGLEFDVAGEAVLVGARTAIGLSDVRDRPDAPLRNTAFEVFIGMLLR